MRWEKFVKERKAKKTFSDKEKAKSLIAMSREILNLFTPITILDENASSITSNYYEALREIVEAICLVHGWNVYSHEAFTAFLREALKEEEAARKFDRFRIIRNRINYYGRKISAAESKENKKEILELIGQLKEKYLKNL